MLFTTLRHYLGPYRGSLLAVLGLKIVETIAVLSLPTLNADVILVMEHGDIVEQGAHDELIARRAPTTSSTGASSPASCPRSPPSSATRCSASSGSSPAIRATGARRDH